MIIPVEIKHTHPVLSNFRRRPLFPRHRPVVSYIPAIDVFDTGWTHTKIVLSQKFVRQLSVIAAYRIRFETGTLVNLL